MPDPAADLGRRAWADCPRCADDGRCVTCREQRRCETHWRFLLHAESRWVFLQCPECEHRWWHDTGFGVGDRPAGLDTPPEMPPPGRTAA